MGEIEHPSIGLHASLECRFALGGRLSRGGKLTLEIRAATRHEPAPGTWHGY
jgi:hypothetical protein